MTRAVQPSRLNEHTLLWGLVLSVALHALAVSALHPFSFDRAIPPPALEIELQPPKPEPPPPPPPEVAKPEPPKPEPTPKPKPLPKKVIEPLPVKTPEPAPRVEAPPPPPPPAVIAAAPKEEPPAFVAPPPPPEPPKPTGPTQQDLDAARSNYGSQLAREFAKHRQYPRVAQMRGWQGTAHVQLEIDASGNVLSSRISESSGHDVLDKQALEMVRKASPLPLPPDVLRNRQFTIDVPVVFRLE